MTIYVMYVMMIGPFQTSIEKQVEQIMYTTPLVWIPIYTFMVSFAMTVNIPAFAMPFVIISNQCVLACHCISHDTLY